MAATMAATESSRASSETRPDRETSREPRGQRGAGGSRAGDGQGEAVAQEHCEPGGRVLAVEADPLEA